MARIMMFLAACTPLLWLPDHGPSQFATAKPMATATASAAPTSSAKPIDTSWAKNIHTVRAGDAKGTAVSVAPGTLYTAQHVAEHGKGWAYVAVNRKWVLATARPITNAEGRRDGAILTITDAEVPPMQVRPAKYRESVTIFGMKSRTRQRGLIVSADMLSLDESEPGVDRGDSGGAVVADDGSLVGILRAYESEQPTLGTEANRRVVHFTRAELFAEDNAPASPAKTPQKPAAVPQANCPNGQCRPPQLQQPQFFFRRR